MRRQLIGLSVLAAVGVAGAWVVPGPAMGETTADDVVVVRSFPADRPAFRRLAVGVGRTPAVLPGYLRSRSLVTATVLLAGESVADAVIAEQAAGRNPTKSQRSLKRRAVAAAQSALLRRVQDSGVGVVYVMQDAINGVVVRGTPAQIESLRLLPGVLEVEPSKTVMRSNTQANSGTGVSAVWEETGTTGAGQVIAVIDTGVDYTHSTFGGTGDPADFAANDSTLVEPGSFPTAKVVGGWDFVGDAFDSSSDDPAALVPTQDADPLDCEGHGTHVAGTAAGLGVNPDGTTYTGPYTEADVASLRIGPGSAPEPARIQGVRL
jgi:subtilisin family serine protease